MQHVLDIILKIFGIVFTPVFTFFVGYITSKRKENKIKKQQNAAEYNAMRETCKLTLRQNLHNDYEYYTAQGYCSIEDKDEVEAEYNLYHKVFNGNGRGTRYYKGIMSLPNEPHTKD